MTQATPQNPTQGLILFSYDTMDVRTIVDEQGAPWFVARDVCDILELENITWALDGIDKEDLTLVELKSGGQKREMKIVSEAGLYELIFKSKKPQAKMFRKWVTKEVLPAIRKKGYYGTLPESSLDAIADKVATVVVPMLLPRLPQAQFTNTSSILRYLEWLPHDLKSDCFTLKRDLYQAYTRYCHEQGEQADSTAHFFTKLYRCEPLLKSARIQVGGKRTPVVVGISLRTREGKA